jgi:hypothetical protein
MSTNLKCGGLQLAPTVSSSQVTMVAGGARGKTECCPNQRPITSSKFLQAKKTLSELAHDN